MTATSEVSSLSYLNCSQMCPWSNTPQTPYLSQRCSGTKSKSSSTYSYKYSRDAHTIFLYRWDTLQKALPKHPAMFSKSLTSWQSTAHTTPGLEYPKRLYHMDAYFIDKDLPTSTVLIPQSCSPFSNFSCILQCSSASTLPLPALHIRPFSEASLYVIFSPTRSFLFIFTPTFLGNCFCKITPSPSFNYLYP